MTDYDTEHGTIHYGGPCKDDYPNIQLYQQRKADGPVVKLQGPAMRAFKAAEVRVGREIPLTGSWRSCANQAQLYASDPQRYADPAITAHTRGLAIDVSTAIGLLMKMKVKRALKAEGWKQVRPDDEPWHWSFKVCV
jgi:hypothetical protein